jgi:hypothetical protein
MICGHDIKIVYKNLGLSYFAKYDSNVRRIYLNTNKKAHWSMTHLFHESLHAILHLTAQSTLLSTAQEEAIVEALEMNLWPMITFNIAANKKPEPTVESA